jgi:sialate O-acetylesterase
MKSNRSVPFSPVLLAAGILTSLPAVAGVRLPGVFTDNMMLQRDQPVRVWGWAEADEAVSATLAGKTSATKADGKGLWSLELPAVASGENLELTVMGRNTVTLKNIIMGDLWVCSGQSNMEMELGGCVGFQEDQKAANLPKIRRIKFNHTQSGQPEMVPPVATPWQVCTPETVVHFSAVGFYFAREIVQKTGVPIGIVDNNWGGTAIEPWVPMEGLGQVAELKPQYLAKQEAIKNYRAALPASLSTFEAWIAQTRKDLAAGTETSPPPAFPAQPDGGWSSMYNAMIHPMVKSHIKGALWYQGESNGGEGESYYDKMRALIGGWRQQWGQGDFPFYFVQLANFQAVSEDPAGGNGWAKLRDAQTKSLSVPNTGMAVITDTVPLAERDDIHPRNKYDVGLRLSRWALARDYGMTDIEVSGPLFQSHKTEGGRIQLSFSHSGKGLMVGKKEGRSPAAENAGAKLKGFAIAGADRKWAWAEAVIEGNTVAVSSPAVKEPVAVRYAWQMNPDGSNLYNRDGLPASPFRTDAW